MASSSQTDGEPNPVLTKVANLKPGTNRHTLAVKVLATRPVLQRGQSTSRHLRNTPISEFVVGDSTGTIVFTARGDQVDLMKLGAIYILRGAKIELLSGNMMLTVDRRGGINEVTQPGPFWVNVDNVVSAEKYE